MIYVAPATSSSRPQPSTRHPPRAQESTRTQILPTMLDFPLSPLLSVGFHKAIVVPNPAIVAITNKMINRGEPPRFPPQRQEHRRTGINSVYHVAVSTLHGETCYGMNCWYFFLEKFFFLILRHAHTAPARTAILQT